MTIFNSKNREQISSCILLNTILSTYSQLAQILLFMITFYDILQNKS
jgi:hypothetical protein